MFQKIGGVIGWIGTALVLGAIAIRMAKPEWAQYGVYLAWAGLAAMVIYAGSQWREIGQAFARRQARYGALASVSVLVALGVLVAVNYLSNRTNKRWDLTANQQFSLSEQTVKLLEGLKEPVKFLVFERPTGFDRYRVRLEEFRYHSDQVQPEYIDPDTKPVLARQYEVQNYGTVVIEYQGRKERVASESEQDLTNGLIKVLNPAQKKVFLLKGHGEKDHQSTERDGYASAAEAIKRDNFALDTLVLAQQKDVPEDAAVIIMAGPTADLLQPEADMLRRYLEKGGHLLVLLDPAMAGSRPLPLLEGLLREWSVEVGNNIVVDASGVGQLFGAGPETPVAASYPAHPITDRFNTLTAYQLARSISPITDPNGKGGAQTLAETSANSWAEVDMKELESGKVAMNPDKGDKPGPISIATVVTVAQGPPQLENPHAPPPATDEPPKPETRLVVFGDSDFATNGMLGIPGNPDLFMNTVSWLAQQENLISVRPRPAAERRLTITANQQRGLMWMTMGVPLFLFAMAFVVWSKRR